MNPDGNKGAGGVDPGTCRSTLVRKLAHNSSYPLYRVLDFSSRIKRMPARLFVGIAALAGVSVCGLLSTLVTYKMVDQVNDKLAKDEHFSLLGWYFSKTLRLHREYRRFFPDGRLLLQVRVLLGLTFGCLVVGAWAIGFLGR
jgi:hypothetical protein